MDEADFFIILFHGEPTLWGRHQVSKIDEEERGRRSVVQDTRTKIATIKNTVYNEDDRLQATYGLLKAIFNGIQRRKCCLGL